MIRLLTAAFFFTLISGGAVAAPFSVSYVGTMQNATAAGAFFANIVNGETYKVTLVMNNGGTSSQSQTWVASDLVSIKWEFNDSRDVVFEQNIDPSYTDNYSIIGTATTDAKGALTVFFTDISNGGYVFQAVGLPDLVSPAAWFLNGNNDVFYSDADVMGGSYRPWVADAAGGAQMNIASWSNPVAVVSVATSGNAQAAPIVTVPTLPSFLLFALSGLLALFGIVGVRAAN